MIFFAIIYVNILHFILPIKIQEEEDLMDTDDEIILSGVCDPFKDLPFDILFGPSEPTNTIPIVLYFVGVILPLLPSGVYADKKGGKIPLTAAVAIEAVFFFITPLILAKFNYWGIPLLNLFTGLMSGIALPAANTLLAHWIPVQERSILCGFALGGFIVSLILGNIFHTLLMQEYQQYFIVFYVLGGLAILWSIIFWLICYNDPASHRFIQPQEKQLLKNKLERIKHYPHLQIPWNNIFSNHETWFLISALSLFYWSFGISVFGLLEYNEVKEVSLRISYQDYVTGLFCLWLLSIAACILTDFVLFKIIKNISGVRTLNSYVSNILTAIFLVSAVSSKKNTTIMIIFCLSMLGVNYAGLLISTLDMSQNYAGTYYAITHTFGFLAMLLAILTINLCGEYFSLTQWNIVFWLTFMTLLISAVIFGGWVYNERKTWDKIEETK